MYRLPTIKTIGPELGLITRCLIFRPLATSTNSKAPESKASSSQLARLEEEFVEMLPKFFTQAHPLRLYSDDVVLIDNIRGLRTQGRAQYSLQINLVKSYYAVRYLKPRLELLNLVKNPEDSCIKIRWRIVAKPGLLQFMLNFWKFHSTEIWKDGISTMHANSKGEIYCHVCDNIDVDTCDAKEKRKLKNPLVNRGLNVNIKRTMIT